jgi:hypothetical protein
MRNFALLHIILFVSIFIGCELDDMDNPEPENQNIINPITLDEKINLSEKYLDWYLRTAPDSISVSISGGIPPYSLSLAPTISSNAKILQNKLILYPKKGQDASLGRDSLIIQDSSFNSTKLRIEVKSLLRLYKILDSTNLEVYGDTNFNISFTKIYNASWDEFTGDLFIVVEKKPLGLNIRCINVYDTGMFRPLNMEYHTSNKPINERIVIVPKNSQEKIRLTQLNDSILHCQFDMQAKDKMNVYKGSINLKGDIKLLTN